MAQEVKIVASRINKLSQQMRASLSASNAAMDVGDWESAVAAEASFVKAYQEWHSIQATRRPSINEPEQ